MSEKKTARTSAIKRCNPKLHRRLSNPHTSKANATQNLADFYEEVAALREKYGIPELLVVSSMNYEDPDIEGGETALEGLQHLGNPLAAVHLSAFAFGAVKRGFNETIAAEIADE